MKNKNINKKSKGSRFSGGILFLIFVLLGYGILFLILPEKALTATRESGKIIRSIILPLLVVLTVTVCLNLFIHPGRIVRLLGKKTGIRGTLLAAAAGVISMGPIYAWYPFLKEMLSKGAGVEPITVFLNCRAVKPVLLPVMISCFGWTYTILLTFFMVMGAFATGRIMGHICKYKNK
ncbi:MAG: hypothetical protein PVG39_23560 [Desulfobacteraceae bacterium]